MNYALPEKNNATALMLSIELSLPEITHILLFEGAFVPALDINAADSAGVSTLMWVCLVRG